MKAEYDFSKAKQSKAKRATEVPHIKKPTMGDVVKLKS